MPEGTPGEPSVNPGNIAEINKIAEETTVRSLCAIIYGVEAGPDEVAGAKEQLAELGYDLGIVDEMNRRRAFDDHLSVGQSADQLIMAKDKGPEAE